jgi:hypothetical protein
LTKIAEEREGKVESLLERHIGPHRQLLLAAQSRLPWVFVATLLFNKRLHQLLLLCIPAWFLIPFSSNGPTTRERELTSVDKNYENNYPEN